MSISPSRRDLLAAFLGLPAALAGCGAPPPRDLPGELVGASDVFGHRLRDAAGATPAPERWRDAEVVIVGGGVAGLSAAWRLLRSGFSNFVVLELEPEAGGTARHGRSDVTAYPWGAHYLPAPTRDNPQLITLLDEMGILEGRDAEGEPLVAEQFLVRDPDERVFYKGRWYDGLYLHAGESADDRAQLARFNHTVHTLAGWTDGRGRRAFALPVATGSDDAEITALDRLCMGDWLDRERFTSPRLRWWVDYGCRDDYGSTLADTSAWAGLFYFASRIRKPGAEPQPFMTWPEGNGRLVRHFLDKVGDRVRPGLAAADVRPLERDGRPGVDVVAVDRGGTELIGFRARHVILAAPRFAVRHLVRPYRDAPPAHLAAFEYGAWLVVNLHLSDRPGSRGFPLAWDNVLYESPSLGYVVATHQRGLDHGATVFTYYYPLCDANPRAARARLQAMTREEAADIALADLSRAHPDLRPLVQRADVMRWGHAMVRPRPGFLWGGARQAAAAPYRNIHFAHADLGGVGLFEEAFSHGLRAAEEVLSARERERGI